MAVSRFSVQDQLQALAAGGDATGTRILEQQTRVADFEANQAALGPALTGDAAVQQQAVTSGLSRSGLPGFGELKEAISGTSSKTGGTVLSPSAPTATAAEQFFLDRAQRQRSARELDSQLQAFRLQGVNRQTEGTFVGDSVGPALADPLEGVSRDTLLDTLDRQSGTGVFDSAPVQRPGGTEGGSSFAPTGSSFGGGGGSFGGGGSGGGSFGGSGGGGFSGFGGAAGARSLDTSRALADFFRGRNLLIDQSVGDLESRGVQNVDALQGRIPELAAAANVAEGAFGRDIGDDFAQALQEAAGVRGLDVSAMAGVGANFNAGLAANAFLGSAAQLATQTGFEQLLQAGFAPPQNLNFGTIGSLNMAEAELSAQISANIAQSQTAQALFAQALPGIFSGR